MYYDQHADNRLGEFIHRARLDKGFSLRKLSIISDVSYSQINKIERGEAKTPSETTLKKLAKALMIDENEMLLAAGQLPESMQPEVFKAMLKRSVENSKENSYEEIINSSYDHIEDEPLKPNNLSHSNGFFFFFFDDEISFLDDVRDLIIKHNPELSEEKVKELSFDLSDFYRVRLDRLRG